MVVLFGGCVGGCTDVVLRWGIAAVAGSIGVQRRRTRRRERGGRHRQFSSTQCCLRLASHFITDMLFLIELPQSSGSSEEESSDPELWNKM